jgi:hypothetical protein
MTELRIYSVISSAKPVPFQTKFSMAILDRDNDDPSPIKKPHSFNQGPTTYHENIGVYRDTNAIE